MSSTLAVTAAMVVALVTEPPDVSDLEAALLTAAEMPAGFVLDEGNVSPIWKEPYEYADPCGSRPDVETTYADALHRYFVKDGRRLTMTIGAPGARWAEAMVQGLTDQPTICPEYSNPAEESDHRITRVPLPGASEGAAAIADSWSAPLGEGGLNWGRDLTAVVTHGDLVVTFLTYRARNEPKFVTDAEFAAIVAAGAGKLAAFGRGHP